ncbi:MAG: hypothetical protein HZA78_01675 [Candidatus Schekmanbacteria bacterium]|nr:hypothetical protein [Candidatus Schekmanbacteria bacterium]
MKKQSLIEKKEMIKKNPKIDCVLVEKAERLESQLAALGVSTKSCYTLSHPLSTSMKFYCHKG